mgnify:CR=1 FL=1
MLASSITGSQGASMILRVAGQAQDYGMCASRRVLWANMLNLALQHPWLGWGWGEADLAHFMTAYSGPRFCDLVDNAHDLPLHVAVEFGLFAAGVTFIYRISNLSRVEQLSAHDTPALVGQVGRISAYRFYGALFFGAVKLVEAIEDDLPQKTVVLDLKNIIYIDSSGADALMALAHVCQKRHVRLLICGLNHQPMDIAKRTGLLALIGKDCHSDWATGLETALSSENH